MSRSYENINYALRLAKGAERKMICETLHRLSPLHQIFKYRYVGFGSTYFSDFSLFHKTLGISNMISIEEDEQNKDRFNFNCPYDCIDLEFGKSTHILPKIPWDKETIIWLDYDGKLDSSVLSDISIFCSEAISKSILIISVNVYPEQLPSDVEEISISEYRLKQLKERIDPSSLPPGIDGKVLSGWGLAKVCQAIIKNKILSTLSDRNGSLEEGKKIRFRQLFNFVYSDNAKMLTTGGLFYREDETSLMEQCSIDDLEFIRSNGDQRIIEIPNLTKKEIRKLDEQLPTNDSNKLLPSVIPRKDVKNYSDIYRYFPTFTEEDI